MYSNNDGTYLVNFNVYADRYDEIDKADYSLTDAQAKKNMIL